MNADAHKNTFAHQALKQNMAGQGQRPNWILTWQVFFLPCLVVEFISCTFLNFVKCPGVLFCELRIFKMHFNILTDLI